MIAEIVDGKELPPIASLNLEDEALVIDLASYHDDVDKSEVGVRGALVSQHEQSEPNSIVSQFGLNEA